MFSIAHSKSEIVNSELDFEKKCGHPPLTEFDGHETRLGPIPLDFVPEILRHGSDRRDIDR